MIRIILLFVICYLIVPALSAEAANFRFQKLKGGVHAAIAEPGGKAASNALIIVTDYQVILAGAHFLPETTKELLEYVKSITPIPVRYIILTHHHRGFNHIDFDLPANAEIIISAPAWQALKSEYRQIKNQITFFDRNLSMKRGSTLVIMSAAERGHSAGDVFIFLPEEGILFTSDLFFNDVAGYMGDGHFRDWIVTLELLSDVDSSIVVPGLGKVTTREGIQRFLTFFRDFTTEILRLAAKGLDIEAAKRQFALPQYETLPGFNAFLDVNFRRAYNELKDLK